MLLESFPQTPEDGADRDATADADDDDRVVDRGEAGNDQCRISEPAALSEMNAGSRGERISQELLPAAVNKSKTDTFSFSAPPPEENTHCASKSE